ncbi:MAG: hypothetical protein AAF665_14530 [Pseudomonadota bacterium]
MTDNGYTELNGQTDWVPPLGMGEPELIHRQRFQHRTIAYASVNEIPGDYDEFGCSSACTFRITGDPVGRKRRPTRLLAFDSFEGLPASHAERNDHRKRMASAFSKSPAVFSAKCNNRSMDAEED